MDFKEKYFSDYMSVYELHKKYHGICSDEEWEAFISEANQIYQGGKPFVRSLIRDVIDELARDIGKRKER